ncbi:protein cueball-like [Daphnia pulex]|uniref:protein cueball-like n=1 Tax=Daphnia pulex TaxID=6669 RepID=UPI001EDF65C6|nr:protein cueball-like [Daphnia pulex]
MKLEAFVIFIWLTLATVSSYTHDDLIIAAGDQLELLSQGTTYRKLTLNSYNASKLSALAYDATNKRLFFSDIRHLESHILSVSLEDESPRLVEEIIEKNNDETVESLAYDPVNKMLLWTDGFNRSIRQIQIDNDGIHAKENTSVEVVHLLESDARPQALVSDPCTRMLYWTNIHNSLPTIERSHLNGSQREVIVHSDLLQLHAFDLDIMEQMIYWAEDLRNGFFLIERSYVNGSGREEFYRGFGHFIASLTVGEDYVYWSDYDRKKLWSLPKDGSSKNPVNLRTYRNPAMGVVVYRNEPLNCDLISSPEASAAVVQKTELIENLDSSSSTALLLGFSFVCLAIMAMMILLILQFLKSRDCKGIRGASKTEDTIPFQNFSNTLFKMNELSQIEQQQTVSVPMPENSSGLKRDDDCATLIKCEF